MSALLIILGVFTIRANTEEDWFFFASLPILFGVQQFVEGVIWVVLESGGFPLIQSIATYIFLAFAIMGWPAYVTLALYKIEKEPFRKRILKGFMTASIILAVGAAAYLAVFTQKAAIVGGHIVYSAAAPVGVTLLYAYIIIYVFLAVLSFFVTHRQDLKIFGGLITLSVILTIILWRGAFVSVWCFFAAIISLYVYYIVRFRKE